jgi:hypothetical protein
MGDYDPLVDLSMGVTSVEWLAKGVGGLETVPPGEIDWLFDIGSGDGHWSRKAGEYAPAATLVCMDWRQPALAARPDCVKGAPSGAERVWVPDRVGLGNRSLLLDMAEVPGLTLNKLMLIYGANPERSVIRYQGPACLGEFLGETRGIRYLTGVVYGSPADLLALPDCLRRLFAECEITERKGVLYAQAWN